MRLLHAISYGLVAHPWGPAYYVACLVMLVAAYVLNMTYVTVFYHRALAHGAVTLAPWLRRFVARTGNWVTGIDPKAWACMHRHHHLYSDTRRDPHSPHNAGIFGVLKAQLHAYERTLALLLRGKEEYTSLVADMEFPVHWLNRGHYWVLPYALHGAIALGLGFGLHAWLLGACYFLGLMSHPIQGWLVNSFAHAVGYRNFATPDQSRNNTLVAWFVMGEGYQNNHHRHPGAANFAMRWFELDPGYWICLALKACRMLTIRQVRPAAA